MTSIHSLTFVLTAAHHSLVPPVDGHGRLWEPPSRSTMWMRGFKTPINYNDNELKCGGFNHQLDQGYKCGVCGDPYDGEKPNEEGGMYATGQISKTYEMGQLINIQVEITSNHLGNSWGEDPNGVHCVGCGPQEEFYGCADVRIIARDSQSNGQPASSFSYFVPAQAATQTFTKGRLQGLSQAPNETPTQNSLTQSPTSSPTQARGSIKMGSTKSLTQASNNVNYFENCVWL